jgi:hypothetical protein
MHDTLDEQFERFWMAYPWRRAKKPARKAFERALKKTSLAAMLQALDWQRLQPQWLKQGGAFIPLPTTWLNQERWDDQPPPQSVGSEATQRTMAAIFGRPTWTRPQ